MNTDVANYTTLKAAAAELGIKYHTIRAQIERDPGPHKRFVVRIGRQWLVHTNFSRNYKKLKKEGIV